MAAAIAVEKGLEHFSFTTMESAGDAPPSVAVFRHEPTGMLFSLIPGGRFEMGSPPGEAARREDEDLHTVTLEDPFLLAQHEVTTSVWKAVMDTETLPRSIVMSGDQPVSGVSWRRARDFCEETSLELPTEKMWEFAVRAGTTTRFFWGDDVERLGEYAWTPVNSPNDLRPVGQKRPNPHLLYDVFGNVSEWCSDTYGPYSERDAVQTGTADWPQNSIAVTRGGNTMRATDDMPILMSFFGSARRAPTPRGTAMVHIGFRPCYPISQEMVGGAAD